jgi:heme exporter protein D
MGEFQLWIVLKVIIGIAIVVTLVIPSLRRAKRNMENDARH